MSASGGSDASRLRFASSTRSAGNAGSTTSWLSST
jgi:hypothetical protein